MFTGIVEELGQVVQMNIKEHGNISIHAKKVQKGLNLGDSIAVNGICLTVTKFDESSFTADVMSETSHRTNLNTLKIGSYVNLERAIELGGRFGGHIVSGHIDDIGVLKDIKTEQNAIWFNILCDKSLLKYIVEKGSITLDGASLTVASVMEKGFCVSLIPHTITQTIFQYKKALDNINIEVDILGKYVESLMFHNANEKNKQSTINAEFLDKCGF